jgi:hypothetical protein
VYNALLHGCAAAHDATVASPSPSQLVWVALPIGGGSHPYIGAWEMRREVGAPCTDLILGGRRHSPPPRKCKKRPPMRLSP